MAVQSNVSLIELTSLKKVAYNSELIYLIELGKYLKEVYNGSLSLKDVIFGKHFHNLDKYGLLKQYLNVAVQRGWLVDVEVETEEPDFFAIGKNERSWQNVLFVPMVDDSVPLSNDTAQRTASSRYRLETPKPTPLYYLPRSNGGWLVTTTFDFVNSAYASSLMKYSDQIIRMTSIMSDKRGDILWLSLVARAYIDNLMTGSPSSLSLRPTNSYVKAQEFALCPFFFLRDKSKLMANSFVDFSWHTDVNANEQETIDIYTWQSYNSEVGITKKQGYAPKVKLDYMERKDLKVGDFVMVYKFHKRKADSRSVIEYGYLAHILEIGVDKTHNPIIKLEYIMCDKPYYQAKDEFDNLPDDVKCFYKENTEMPYEFKTRTEVLDFISLGVDHVHTSEPMFMVQLQEVAKDRTDIIDKDSEGNVTCVNLGVREALYWVCADAMKRGRFTFDKERFIARELGGCKPAYERWMDGERWSYGERVERIKK